MFWPTFCGYFVTSQSGWARFRSLELGAWRVRLSAQTGRLSGTRGCDI